MQALLKYNALPTSSIIGLSFLNAAATLTTDGSSNSSGEAFTITVVISFNGSLAT